MPYQFISVRRARYFTPDEAHIIAAEFRTIASEARDLAARLRAIHGSLEATWEGQAKKRFLVDFSCEPSVGESNASWVEAEAQRIGTITVTVWETVMEKLWVPGPEDQGKVGM